MKIEDHVNSSIMQYCMTYFFRCDNFEKNTCLQIFSFRDFPGHEDSFILVHFILRHLFFFSLSTIKLQNQYIRDRFDFFEHWICSSISWLEYSLYVTFLDSDCLLCMFIESIQAAKDKL